MRLLQVVLIVIGVIVINSFHNRLIEVLIMKNLFKKNVSSDYTSINIKKELYYKLQLLSEMENKTFSEVIEDSLKGKTISL